MEKVRPWCGQPSDRGRLKNRQNRRYSVYLDLTFTFTFTLRYLMAMFSDCPSPPPGQVKVSKVTSTSCHLDWDSPEDDGGSPVTSYIVEKLVGGGGEWETVGCSHVRHLVVWALVDAEQYRFRVAAENVHGRSGPGAESDEVVAGGSALLMDHDAASDMNYDSLGASVQFCVQLFAPRNKYYYYYTHV